MESTSKAHLTDIWQKYKTALTRLDWALDELAKRPTVSQQPQVAQLTPAYPVPTPTDSTEFSIESKPADIRDQKPDDIHKLFIEGSLPLEYRDMIKLIDRGTHIQSTAVTKTPSAYLMPVISSKLTPWRNCLPTFETCIKLGVVLGNELDT